MSKNQFAKLAVGKGGSAPADFDEGQNSHRLRPRIRRGLGNLKNDPVFVS